MSDTPSPRVTAIVLNWCSEGDTSACLRTLAASRYDSLTVLLIDNGSPDGSGERLRRAFPEVSYLETGANLGYAEGNNRGFAWALDQGAEYALVINDDAVIDESSVELLVRAAEETDAAVVTPRILYFDEPERIWYDGGMFSPTRALGVHLHEDEPAVAEQARSPVSFVCGCCFLIRADALRRVGGFDQAYFAYMEDVELSLRLARAGFTMVHEPRARVLHRIERNAASTPFQIRQRDRNRRRLVAQHYGLTERLRFAAWFYPTRLVHWGRYLIRGDRERAAAVVDGALGRFDARVDPSFRQG